MQVDVTPQLKNPIRRVAETPRLGIASLCALAAVVGIVTGFGALLFRIMISFVHNLFFLKTISLSYDSSLFTPSQPVGSLDSPGAGRRFYHRHVHRGQFRAGSEGPWRARGDGRDLL